MDSTWRTDCEWTRRTMTWAVDEGTDMVIKFSPDGRVQIILGKRPEFEEEHLPDAGSGIHHPAGAVQIRPANRYCL